MKMKLVLENGACFEGTLSGVKGERIGEVILNTSVVGYQEIMTDSANAGKILVMTYPLIGNYGVADKFYESQQCRLSGLVVKEISRIYSNWQAEGPFTGFLEKEKLTALTDIDTRTLAVTIRDSGEMLGIIGAASSDKSDLLAKLNDFKKEKKTSLIKEVSVSRIKEISAESAGARIAVLDLGISNGFLSQLSSLGCSITLLPYNTPAEKIAASKFDGLVVSNGPENDPENGAIAENVKKLIGSMPILGIAAGHEIIGLALGFKVKKMHIGHRGVNYPVKGADSFKGEITVQNHSFIIDEDSVSRVKDLRITLRNVNDDSIEEMESGALKLISAQYYPVSSGFGEPNDLFIRFLRTMPRAKKMLARRKTNPAQKEVAYAKT